MNKAKAIEVYPNLMEGVIEMLGDRVDEFDLEQLEVTSAPSDKDPSVEFVYVSVPRKDGGGQADVRS